MSATSRLLVRSGLALCAAAALAVGTAFAMGKVSPPPLPERVAALAPDARPQGGGELRYFGLSIYDGFYWSPARSFSVTQAFALDLHYHRTLTGDGIAGRSIDEIRKLGIGSPGEHTRWLEAMQRLFPDVRKGDRLTGVNIPGHGAKFFHNGASIGEIADTKFARAFFGIWLDPQTSRPDFRERLLGEK
jgi:hypothetical protein